MDSEKAWQKILSLIKEQVSGYNFRVWFSQSKLSSLDDHLLEIAVPSAFIKGQLINRYEKLLTDSVAKALGKNLKINYIIDSSLGLKTPPAEQEEDLFHLGDTKSPLLQTTLNSKYTLENFVVGLTNNLAYAASQAVVQNPGTSYNPLFIYGPSGVGKTHLMQAIGNSLINKNPYLKIIYAPSERFMNDFVDSIQTKTTGAFRQKYRSCDILLIDDIQFISGKDSTQEEFFHAYNDLHSKNSQLIFTSDRPPAEIQKLESRLLSRFQGGLMVDVQLPDFDTRVAILRAKLKEKGETVKEDILKLIAEAVPSNTRELEGKLVQLLQMSKLSNQPPSIELVQKILGAQQSPKRQLLDYKKVLSAINNYFNLKLSDLIGPRRQKELVLPRQIAMYLMYQECRIPMEKIGQVLGGRDHTTVLHGIEKIKAAISRDREVQRLVIEVRQQLTS
ncbi:chromosomal replication initiator protein DnaA [Candidatus Daviesbacteria bacterium]|nr:chromosomal replication initiator protein DnaA [Candidatus Daviesbacteria bacterium]